MSRLITSKVIINNSVTLKTYENARIDLLLDKQKKVFVSRHRNCFVLERLVDSVCFLGSQKLSFRGHDKAESSDNKSKYVELILLIAK